MDILDIRPSTLTVDIKHPATGASIGLIVECVSMESDQVKAVERSLKNRALKSGWNLMTAEDIEKNAAMILSAAIVGWAWGDGLTLGGMSNPAPTAENKRKLLAVGWIAKQIDKALGDEAAFFQDSATA